MGQSEDKRPGGRSDQKPSGQRELSGSILPGQPSSVGTSSDPCPVSEVQVR